MIPNTTRRESDDGYTGVVARLNARWRVITCRDGIQWILQYLLRVTERATGSDWRGRSYCRTRDGLHRACACHAGEIHPAALAILHALPVGIEERRP
jgi:hypothetical protein